MKKLICIVLLVLCAIAIASCSSSDLTKNERVSELRSNILIGESAGYKVVAVTGFREDPFEYDGFSSAQKVQFTVITVTPTQYNAGVTYTFKTTLQGVEYAESLLKHPYNQSYSAEINVTYTGSELDVTITCNGSSETITATSVKNDSFIDGEKAFSIAKKNLDVPKKGDYEIFVRLIENPINADGGYYWYVAFYFADKTTLAVLIDPVTMEILAQRD